MTVKDFKNSINDIRSRDDNKTILFCGSALNEESYDDLDISWIDCSDAIVICINKSPT